MKKILSSLLVLFLMFGVVACDNNKKVGEKTEEKTEEKTKFNTEGQEIKRPVEKGEKRDKEFDKYVDTLPKLLVDSTDYQLNYFLVDKEAYGFDDELYSFHVLTYEEWMEDNKNFEGVEKKLKTFDKEKLSPEQQLTYDVLVDAFGGEATIDLESYYNLSTNYLDENYGAQGGFALELYFYNFRNEEDVKSYLNLMEELPEYFDALVENEQTRQDNGYGMTQSEVDAVAKQADDFVDGEHDYLITSFNKKIEDVDGLSSKEIRKYKKENKKLIDDGLIEAYSDLSDGLADLDVESEDGIGYAQYENGKEYYLEQIQSQVGFETIDEYRTYLNKKRIELEGEISNLSTTELSNAMYGSVDYTDAKSSDDALDDLSKDMKRDFPKLKADVSYTMETVPQSMQSIFTAEAAYFTSPADEMNTNEKMVLNGEYDQDLFTTIAHEGFPGHMYQMQYYKQVVPHPLVRDVLSYSGYTEGYANYVEQYSIKYANDPEAAKNAQIVEQYMYVQILISDIEIHYDGLGIDKFVDRQRNTYRFIFGYDDAEMEKLKEILNKDSEDMIAAYNQLLHTPAIFPKYYAAGFRIADLREKYSDYTDKEFHEALLHVGASPYNIMDEYIGIYLEENFK